MIDDGGGCGLDGRVKSGTLGALVVERSRIVDVLDGGWLLIEGAEEKMSSSIVVILTRFKKKEEDEEFDCPKEKDY
jgi:hypothetical protein